MAPAETSKVRRVLRVLGVGFLLATISCVGLAITAVLLVKQVASRIVIDPEAFGQVIREGIVVSLRDGPREQKLELIEALGTAGPGEAAAYVPLLSIAAEDKDPGVREAAKATYEHISGGFVGPPLPK
jgi:hypothetical protein